MQSYFLGGAKMISEYDYNEANKAFERSKYKKLEEIISHADIEKMSAKELVQLISFKALVEQKLHKIYWSDEVAQLEILALEKAYIRERRDLEAKLLRNEAQIIIRNKKDDKRFNRAIELLSLADDCFARQGNKLKALAARIYTLGRVGFCINEFLARIRGE